MFKTRLISGIFLVLAAFLTIYAGRDILLVTLLGVSVIGMGELYKTEKMTFTAPAVIGYLAAAGYALLLRLLSEGTLSGEANALRLQGAEWLWMYGMLLLILLLGCYVFTFPKYKAKQIMMAFFGFFYVAVMLFFIYRTRMLENGQYLVWLIFLSSWGYDTCAYCVGMITAKTVGNHKMTPKLSPKKSIEGAVGGLIGAMLLGAVYAAAATALSGTAHPKLEYAVICGVGAVIAQIGDLAASAVKRDYEMKDYGHIIPGHGGVLDRFDSVIFTAPMIYYLSVLLLG